MTIQIYGAGGLGREVLASLQASGRTVGGFVVDLGYFKPDHIRGLPVQVFDRDACTSELILAIGDGRMRASLDAGLGTAVAYADAVHPAAVIGPAVVMGQGAMIIGIASMTTDIRLGRHVLVNPGCTIAHDCEIGDFCSLGPSVSLAGRVRLEQGVSIGTGASVAPSVVIGAWAIVGAGAAVLRDVPPGATVVGVPARPLQRQRVSNGSR